MLLSVHAEITGKRERSELPCFGVPGGSECGGGGRGETIVSIEVKPLPLVG